MYIVHFNICTVHLHLTMSQISSNALTGKAACSRPVILCSVVARSMRSMINKLRNIYIATYIGLLFRH